VQSAKRTPKGAGKKAAAPKAGIADAAQVAASMGAAKPELVTCLGPMKPPTRRETFFLAGGGVGWESAYGAAFRKVDLETLLADTVRGISFETNNKHMTQRFAKPTFAPPLSPTHSPL
jgi:hypothetical protein